MCFTPIISLTTAIIEFVVATFILFYYRKSSFSKAVVILLYLLGLYQFSEFMLCTSNPVIWAKVGFISYTFLPALGLKFTLDYVKRKHSNILIFIIPIIASLIAILKKDFIIKSSCEKYFVIIRYVFSQSNLLIKLYWAYYFGFIVIISYLLIAHYLKQRNKIKKEIDLDIIIGIWISLLPALILLFLFPALFIKFPSIYCQFALIFTITTLIAFHLEKKLQKRK